MSKRIHYPQKGKKYGKLTVISEEVFRHGKDKKIHYQVKCDCGHEQLVRAYFLEIGRQTCCKSCSQKEALLKYPSRRKFLIEEHLGVGNFTKTVYSYFKRNAKRRGLDWDESLTIEFLYKLLIKQNRKCALSGLDIDLTEDRIDSNINFKKMTASLDRIDSSKGYKVNNVQWVHKDINKMKNNYSEDYFKKLCKLVANQQGS